MVVANAGSNQAICSSGGSVQLNASGGVQYSWWPTVGLSNPNIANPIASPTVTTSYSVMVTSSSGCTDSDTMVVFVNNSGIIPNVYNNGNIVWTDTYLDYQWQFNNSSINGATAQSYTAPVSGFYSVVVTDGFGCTGTSNLAFIDAAAPPSCLNPDSQWTTSFSDTSVVVNWSYIPYADQAITSYRTTSPIGQWIQMLIDPYQTNSHTINGLSPATTYQWQVKIVCGQDTTAWLGMDNFTTLPVNLNCPAVSNQWVDQIGPSSARLNWLAPQNAHHFEIRGRRSGTTPFITIQVPQGSPNFKDVYGLANGFQYEWEIRTICNAGGTGVSSGWSGLQTFTTGCLEPDSIWTDPVTSNGARLNWQAVVGAVGYEIRGRRIGTTGLTAVMVQGGSTNSKDVFGLLAGSGYEWTIRAWCNQNGTLTSPFSPFTTFTTLNAARMQLDIDNREVIFDHQVNLFPNPADNNLFIETNVGYPEQFVDLAIYNLSGKMMFEEKNLNLSEKVNVDVQRLENGIYIVVLKNENMLLTQKLTIIH